MSLKKFISTVGSLTLGEILTAFKSKLKRSALMMSDSKFSHIPSHRLQRIALESSSPSDIIAKAEAELNRRGENPQMTSAAVFLDSLQKKKQGASSP